MTFHAPKGQTYIPILVGAFIQLVGPNPTWLHRSQTPSPMRMFF